MSSKFYSENAAELSKHYLSKILDEVHGSYSKFLPSIIENPNARTLDLGAASGRNVKYFSELQKRHIPQKTYSDYCCRTNKRTLSTRRKTTQGVKGTNQEKLFAESNTE